MSDCDGNFLRTSTTHNGLLRMYSRLRSNYPSMDDERMIRTILLYLRIIHQLKDPNSKTMKELCVLTYFKSYLEDVFPERCEQISTMIKFDLMMFYPVLIGANDR